LRYQCPDLFIEMLLVLRARAQAFMRSQGEDDDEAEEDDGKVETRDTDQGKATPAARVLGRRIGHLIRVAHVHCFAV
jgi:hypothetical protein